MIQKCRHCNEILSPWEGEKASQFKKRIFCNASCSATFNNKSRKRISSRITPSQKSSCTDCGRLFLLTRSKRNFFYKRKYCGECKLDYGFGSRTKGELFSVRKNWQSARSSIRNHANKLFRSVFSNPQCQKCGYSLHVEIAHIKSVSEFEDTVKINEINCIQNLMALCPTHHWEYDNGHLLLREIFSGVEQK